jgi:hypothetical protein
MTKIRIATIIPFDAAVLASSGILRLRSQRSRPDTLIDVLRAKLPVRGSRAKEACEVCRRPFRREGPAGHPKRRLGLSAKLSGTGRPAYILNPDRQEPSAKTELVTSMIERSWRAWSGDGLGVKFAGVPGPWRQAVAAQLSA